MKKIPYVITNNSVVLTLNGVPKTVLKDDGLFKSVIDAIKSEEWDTVEKLLTSERNLEVAVSTLSDPDLRLNDDKLQVRLEDGTWWTCPEDLGKHILKFFKEGLPYKPWVAFAKKLQKNPSYRSVQQLFKFLDAGSFTITDSGNFIAYKRVRNTFFDIHSNTMDNSPGKVLRVARNEVDEDPNRTCSHGLHVAHWTYAANHFGSAGAGDRFVYVEVDPADVVAVPADYSDQKMRVCGYTVLDECTLPSEQPLYSKDEGFYGKQEEEQEYEEYHDDYESDYWSSDSYDEEDEDEDEDEEESDDWSFE